MYKWEQPSSRLVVAGVAQDDNMLTQAPVVQRRPRLEEAQCGLPLCWTEHTCTAHGDTETRESILMLVNAATAGPLRLFGPQEVTPGH